MCAWTWVRPADGTLLAGRPLLDLGTGDGQTISALAPDGLVVGLDRAEEVLRTARVAVPFLVVAEGLALPFASGVFEVVVAGDLFHHLDGEALGAVLGETARVLRDGGRLVAWWYEEITRADPHGPRFARACGAVIEAARASGFADARPIELVSSLDPTPKTTGVVATRR